MDKIIIYGNSSIAEVVAEYIKAVDTVEIVAFTVEEDFIQNKMLKGKPVIPYERLVDLYSPVSHKILVLSALGIESPRVQKKVKSEEIKSLGYKLFSFIDPSAYIANSAKIGENCIILNRSIVEPFAEIGDGTFLRSESYVSHHSKIGSYCYLAPRATIAGKVEIGSFCFLGINCTVHDKKKIGAHSIIGGGAVVNNDIPDYGVVKAASGKLLNTSSKNFRI